jgi:hypothetical protein
MNSESIQLAQELKKSINSDIYKTTSSSASETSRASDTNSSPSEDNIQEIEKKYLGILGDVYKSANAILSGKVYTYPNFGEMSEKTRDVANRFFNHLRDIVPNIDEQDKLEYKDALENYFRIFPWIIRNEMDLP